MAQFSEKELLNIKRVFCFSLQLLFKTVLILRKVRRDIVTNTKTSSRKVPVILDGFLRNLSFLDRLSKKKKLKISSKSVQWELNCSMRTEGRTDMTKVTVSFRNFANAPKHQFCWCRANVSPDVRYNRPRACIKV